MPAWRVFSGFGSAFSIQLGNLKIKDGRIESDWRLHFHFIPWEIFYQNKLHVSSADVRVRILDLIGILEGKTLIDIEFCIDEYKTILDFDYGSSIHVYHTKEPNIENKDDFWGIRCPNNKFIGIGPGNYWELFD